MGDEQSCRTGNPRLGQNTGERRRRWSGPVLTLILSSLEQQTILASNVKQSRYGYYGNVNLYHGIGSFVDIAFIVKHNFLSKEQCHSGKEKYPVHSKVFSEEIFPFYSNCEDI